MASAAARAQKSDWPTTIPAKNAPKTMEAPKNSAEYTATPSAMTSTASVNKSRAPVRATYRSTSGMTFFPANSVRATSRASLTNIQPSSERMPPQSPGAALARFHHGGDENQQQNGKQVFHYQPSQSHMAAGRMEVLVVFQHPRQHYGTRHGNRHAKNQSGNRGPSEHPPDQHSQHGSHGYLHNGSRDGHFCTAIKSFKWKWSPTPNISRITPSSANCSTVWESATNPGEYGPTTTPASR